jgi:DNA-binding CsgD family transcriptional regulator
MESRRALNPAMPTALVLAQLGLYLGAVYAVGRGMAALRFPGWELLIGCWQLLAAYGIANERRWGWRLGLAAAAVSVLPAVDQFVRSPAIAKQLTRSLVAPEPQTVNTLTDREREVLVLVAKGLSNQQIADSLVISERTARTHVSNILSKLGVASRTQAALLAIRDGIAPAPRVS